MTINIPRNFYNQRKFNYLKYDDSVIVDYKIYNKKEKIYAFSHSNIIIIILKGKKILKCSAGEYAMSQGEIYFVKKGNYIMNQIADLHENKYESIIICLSDNLLNEFCSKYSTLLNDKYNKYDKPTDRCIKINASVLLNKEIETLLYFFNNNLYNEILKLKIFSILLNILCDNDNIALNIYLKEFLINNKLDFKKFIEENYYRPLSIEDFAKSSGRSLTTFKKHFKDIFNDTPNNWINNKRLEKAEYLLSSTSYNITEICFMVGFQNLSHFIKLFKKVYGYSPKQYKKVL